MQRRLKYPVLLACLVTYTNATLKIRSKGQVDYGNENPKLRPIQEAKTFSPLYMKRNYKLLCNK